MAVWELGTLWDTIPLCFLLPVGIARAHRTRTRKCVPCCFTYLYN